MQSLCSTCPEKTKDFGGCRCQAYLLTGDASNADPVCSKSGQRELIDKAMRESQAIEANQPMVFRNKKASRDYG
jgi:pyrroloquinoline quinone biosynthesis protein E